MNNNILIHDSAIEGKGVFANRDFKKGEVIIKWAKGHIISQEEFEQLPKEEKKYVSYFKGKYRINQPPERYVNHSCDPNTYVENNADVASRDIKKGEEITSDYTKEGVPHFDLKCNCGSKYCRKVIR